MMTTTQKSVPRFKMFKIEINCIDDILTDILAVKGLPRHTLEINMFSLFIQWHRDSIIWLTVLF